MRLVFEPELAFMDAYAEGREEIEGILDGSVAEDGERLLLARFDAPVLVTDPYRISLFPPAKRDLLHAFFGRPRRSIEYDGTTLDFDQTVHPRVWSPSIDTLLVCRALRGLFAASGARSLLEIGSGSGFLALYAMEALRRRGSPLDEVHLIDIEPQAVECGMAALERTSGGTLVTASLGRRGEALRVRGRYDLILMNPPYIRRPPDLARGRYQDNPWEGVALIRELGDRGPELLTPGGSIVMVVSSLCDDLVMPWLEPVYSIDELARLEVPLKVYAVTSRLTHKSRAWMDFLQASEGLTLCDPPRHGYDAWQELRVVRCRVRG